MREIRFALLRAHFSFRFARTSLSLQAVLGVFFVVVTMIGFDGKVGQAGGIGSNRGGVLIVHVDDNLIYTVGAGGYAGDSGIECEENYGKCQDQQACQSETIALNPTMASDDGCPMVFWALAAFPSNSCPRLSGITFGITYDENAFVLEAWGHSGDFAIPSRLDPIEDYGFLGFGGTTGQQPALTSIGFPGNWGELCRSITVLSRSSVRSQQGVLEG